MGPLSVRMTSVSARWPEKLMDIVAEERIFAAAVTCRFPTPSRMRSPTCRGVCPALATALVSSMSSRLARVMWT